MSIREGQPPHTLSVAQKNCKRGINHKKNQSLRRRSCGPRLRGAQRPRQPARSICCSNARQSDMSVSQLSIFKRSTGQMTTAITLHSRADFTIDSYRSVAWQGRPVAIANGALQRMADCRTSFLRLIDGDPDLTVYGVTSGYGQFAPIRLSAEARPAHPRTPPFGS